MYTTARINGAHTIPSKLGHDKGSGSEPKLSEVEESVLFSCSLFTKVKVAMFCLAVQMIDDFERDITFSK